MNNYKLLQAAFLKLGINKKPDIEKLARGKYQDNLEFMQWFKGFLSNHAIVEGYDPVSARAKGKGAKQIPALFGAPGTVVTTTKARRHTASGALGAEKASKQSLDSAAPPPQIEKENRVSPRLAKEVENEGMRQQPTAAREPSTAHRSSKAPTTEGKRTEASSSSLEALISAQRTHIDGVERERNFYFDKLREIEALIQDREGETKGEDSELAKSVLKILYATTDDFVVVDGDE